MIVSTFGYKRNGVNAPKNYTIVHNMQNDYDIAFFQDPAILDYMSGRITVPDSEQRSMSALAFSATFSGARFAFTACVSR